jgi:hypothetical protein
MHELFSIYTGLEAGASGHELRQANDQKMNKSLLATSIEAEEMIGNV